MRVLITTEYFDRYFFDDVNAMIHQVEEVEFQGPILLLGTRADLRRNEEEKHVSTIEV